MRYLFIFVFLLVSPVNCLAGFLGWSLQEKLNDSNASDEIPVIVYFKSSSAKNVDNQIARNKLKTIKVSNFKDREAFKKAFKEARKLMRRQHIESLKSDADLSSKQFKRILKSHKKNINRELWLVNALAVNLPPYLINIFLNQPQVDHIDFDAAIKLSAHNVSTSNSPPTWNLDVVKATSLWNDGIFGEGMVIASMDTGVDGQHPDLVSSWRGGTNSWFDPYSEFTQPHDDKGHGTQVMGIMVGGDASGNSIGVAPGAQWIAVKIFRVDQQTNILSASLSAIHSGFQWLLDPDGDPLTDDAPDIVNNSWGSTSSQLTCDTEFHADIDALKVAGIEVVFSAGNSGPFDNTLYSPADYAEVVSVGSVDEFMNVAVTSSRGPSSCSSGFYPNLVAPGVGIYTSDLSFGLGALLDPYVTVQGTSFAAPHMTGVIALLKSAVPTASHNDIRNALYATAQDFGAPGPDDVTGYGLVDAHMALLRLRCPTGITDSDGDGWYDECDNCTLHSNKLQIDTDSDGYGNSCDADINNDGFTDNHDLSEVRAAFILRDLVVDMNEDGYVDNNDLPQIKSLFFSAPGPSALAP